MNLNSASFPMSMQLPGGEGGLPSYAMSQHHQQESELGFAPQQSHLNAPSQQKVLGWLCSVCGNVNFPYRQACYMSQCKAPRGFPGPYKRPANPGPGNAMSPWTCPKCNNYNRASRVECHRRGCTMERRLQSDGSVRFIDASVNPGGAEALLPPPPAAVALSPSHPSASEASMGSSGRPPVYVYSQQPPISLPPPSASPSAAPGFHQPAYVSNQIVVLPPHQAHQQQQAPKDYYVLSSPTPIVGQQQPPQPQQHGQQVVYLQSAQHLQHFSQPTQPVFAQGTSERYILPTNQQPTPTSRPPPPFPYPRL